MILMVKKELVDYIKEHQDSFSDEDLKKAVLNLGYTKEDFKEAKKSYLGSPLTVPPPPPSSELRQKKVNQTYINNEPFRVKFKVAAVCGILFWLLLILLFVVPDILKTSVAIVLAVCGLIFYYGIYTLGKKYSNKLLKISLILILAAFFIIIVASIFWVAIAGAMILQINETINGTAPFVFNESQIQTDEEISFDSEMQAFMTQIMEVIFTVFILGLFIYLVNLVVWIIVGVGLVRLNDKVKLSMPAGILTIIGAILSPLFFLGLAAWIIEIIILFNESKK